MRGALVHDAFYRLIRWGVLSPEWKDYADETMYQLLVKDGMWEWRAKLWLRAVKQHGAAAILAENKMKVHTAP